jgi:hypothetical protein
MPNRRKHTPGINVGDDIANLYHGEIEVIIKDKYKRVIKTMREPNLIKIFSKEMLAHRIAPTHVWDPAASGGGAYVPSNIDPDDEYSIKYVLFGASFDENGIPKGPDDARFYTYDTATGSYIPVRLETGATNDGGLINAIPLSEPDRPLKRVEAVYFEPSYQPTSVPLLQGDVRAMNNVLVVETTLDTSEYNGLGLTDSDYFTLTEVALAGGKELGTIGTCECDPKNLFLEGDSGGDAIKVNLSGSNVVTIDASDTDSAGVIKEGDQLKLVNDGGTPSLHTTLDQISPFYLVQQKSESGLEIQLDRTPVDSNNTPLTGTAGAFRSTLRLFAHRILPFPVQKSSAFEITVRWRIFFS